MPQNRTKSGKSAQVLLLENQVIARVSKCHERRDDLGTLAHFANLLNEISRAKNQEPRIKSQEAKVKKREPDKSGNCALFEYLENPETDKIGNQLVVDIKFVKNAGKCALENCYKLLICNGISTKLVNEC